MASTLPVATSARQPLLTQEDVAEILGVSRDYVAKTLVFQRHIDFIKIGGKVRFEPDAVEKLINSRRIEAQA